MLCKICKKSDIFLLCKNLQDSEFYCIECAYICTNMNCDNIYDINYSKNNKFECNNCKELYSKYHNMINKCGINDNIWTIIENYLIKKSIILADELMNG